MNEACCVTKTGCRLLPPKKRERELVASNTTPKNLRRKIRAPPPKEPLANQKSEIPLSLA